MANASYPRAERVRQAIAEVLATELERMADPGLGLVTITEVTVTPDLRHAKAFYTVYGSDVTEASTKDALKRATGHLRSTVAKQVRLRFAPTLEFKPDPVPKRAAHIDELLARIRKADSPDKE
ncbi:MAG: 30S ribosome-binding factor RbfA [Actinomycetota bacterium]